MMKPYTYYIQSNYTLMKLCISYTSEVDQTLITQLCQCRRLHHSYFTIRLLMKGDNSMNSTIENWIANLIQIIYNLLFLQVINTSNNNNSHILITNSYLEYGDVLDSTNRTSRKLAITVPKNDLPSWLQTRELSRCHSLPPLYLPKEKMLTRSRMSLVPNATFNYQSIPSDRVTQHHVNTQTDPLQVTERAAQKELRKDGSTDDGLKGLTFLKV